MIMLGIIILAAGRGTRMKSSTPKVLHTICGQTMIDSVLQTVKGLNPQQIILVINETLQPYVEKLGYSYVIQKEPLGTGHAVQTALSIVDKNINNLFVLCGDTPFIQKETLQKALSLSNDLTVFGMNLCEKSLHKPYGRFVFNGEKLADIIEFKDANEEQKDIPYANAGVYFGTKDVFEKTLPYIQPHNKANEYYLTDMVRIAFEKGYHTGYLFGIEEEFLGINDQIDLARAEQYIQKKLRTFHLNNGVRLIDPETVYFQNCTTIAPNTVIHPHVIFGKNVHIHEHVTIFPYCHLENCTLQHHAQVGPFARLRGGVTLADHSEVGNFVEVKKSILGSYSKVKHLSYIGDTTTGKKVNIGAGTITCNYDGVHKYQTTIGDGAFIGSNTSLIAPLNIGNNALIGAGSTIVEDVSDNTLSIARAKQVHKTKRINPKKTFQ